MTRRYVVAAVALLFLLVAGVGIAQELKSGAQDAKKAAQAAQQKAAQDVKGAVQSMPATGPAGVRGLQAAPPSFDTAKIDQLTGAKGQMVMDDYKVTLDRPDMSVTASGVKLPQQMGLQSWASFKPMGDHFMTMGDIVTTEDQVQGVMDAALQNGLQVTGLHKHFANDNPRIVFLHIGGMGGQDQLASAVGKVFAKAKEASKGEMKADVDLSRNQIDGNKVSSAIGVQGENHDGIYKVTVPKTTRMQGQEIGAGMGVMTWAAFGGTDDKALMDGDFAMYENELQPVLKALRGANINILAIHNHMTMENPRVMFLHFWGTGSTNDLARGFKAGLDAQKSAGAGLAAPPSLGGQPGMQPMGTPPRGTTTAPSGGSMEGSDMNK